MEDSYYIEVAGRLCSLCNDNCGPICMLLWRKESDTWDTIGFRCTRVFLQAAYEAARVPSSKLRELMGVSPD